MKTVITLDDLRKTACAPLNQELLNQSNLTTLKKKRKYNNEPVEFDGKKFQSTKERDRYILLRYRQGMGEIKELECQVRFLLESNDEKICDYVADFSYTEIKNNLFIVEDVKSAATRKLRPYRMKKKLMFAQYKIEIKEV
jgi:hypothetical protein